jgi:hypothetical protein
MPHVPEGEDRSWGGPPAGSTRVDHRPQHGRSFFPDGRIILAVLFMCAAAGAGVWAYPRYFGGNRTCLLPVPTATGPAITIATPTFPMPVIYGRLALLESATYPMRFNVIPSEVELRDIHYEGQVFGQTALPMHGSVRIVKVDGKYVPIRDNEIKSGCIELRGLGKTIVLFSSSFSPTVTLVLTPEQMKQFR